MFSLEISYIALAISTVLSFMLGGFWYSPKAFGKMWMNQMGVTMNDIEDSGKSHSRALVASFFSSLFMCLVVGMLISSLQVSSVWQGVLVGIVLFLGLNFTSSLKLVFWEDRPVKLTMIDAGYDVSCFILAGAIFAYTQSI